MKNMRNRRGALNFVMLFLLGIVLLANGGCGGSGKSENSASPFAGGVGTPEDPYRIATAGQLAKIKDYRDKSFILISDIDLSSYGNWDPIGTFNMEIDDPEKGEVAKSSLAFVGRFDGNGHTISNLTVNRPDTFGVGLFGFVVGNAAFPSIRNLTVSNADVKGACMVGGVVGVINGGITGIKLTGGNRVEGYAVGAVGGIAGMGYGAIENCTANASVTSNGKGMQGLGLICGGGKWLTVRACTAAGNVTAKGFGAFSVGGLVGCIQESPVMENCAVKATIDASAEKSFMVGGLTGHAGNYDKSNPTLIRNCSADVDITVSASSKRVVPGGAPDPLALSHHRLRHVRFHQGKRDPGREHRRIRLRLLRHGLHERPRLERRVDKTGWPDARRGGYARPHRPGLLRGRMNDRKMKR